jgi:phage terminase small subunit
MKIPTELTDTEKQIWTQYAQDLDSVDKFDRAALVTLCRASALVRLASAELAKTGSVIILPNGYDAPSPYVKIFFEAAKLEKTLLVEMGLTRLSKRKAQPKEPPTTQAKIEF